MPETGRARSPVSGTVLAVLPRALYRVAVGDGREVLAHAATGLGRNFVRLVAGDRVTVEMSPRDAGRGRIVRRD
jgi:translation initiation factor IF-1